ncbi:MAG TPA: Gfo/Idh/MocA family oxidoreductase, partial [Burkholderiales bacterium]|nr:Gfo/Idh/MocA family oxidoreductase [Burkholderiales bacterium]
MKQINVGIVGTGWCGGIRAETARANPLVKDIHVVETRPERLDEIAQKVNAASAGSDYRTLLKRDDIDAIIISATPEALHYPMARESLLAGKHVFMEKPIAIELHEADELIAIARRNKVKFTIGYSQRFNAKYAFVKKAIEDGTIGKPVSALVSRHITRGLGKKITGRSKLSPAAMESTHDLDFLLWCLEPARPVRVYSQVNYGAMREAGATEVPDTQWLTVTLDSGLAFVVGGGWSL